MCRAVTKGQDWRIPLATTSLSPRYFETKSETKPLKSEKYVIIPRYSSYFPCDNPACVARAIAPCSLILGFSYLALKE